MGHKPLQIVASPPSCGWAPNLAVLLTHCGQLLLGKVSKFDATRCQILRLKCTKFDLCWGSIPDPTGGVWEFTAAVTFCQAYGYLRSFHQMALPVNGSTHLIPAYYSIYRPRKDERLSWPSWLTYSGWFTHISGHPSAAGRAQDRESSPARDRRSTTVPRHQLLVW